MFTYKIYYTNGVNDTFYDVHSLYYNNESVILFHKEDDGSYTEEFIPREQVRRVSQLNINLEANIAALGTLREKV